MIEEAWVSLRLTVELFYLFFFLLVYCCAWLINKIVQKKKRFFLDLLSPSDLDADLEDNQDYDSTVSQPDIGCSRTNSSARFPTLPTVPSSLHEGLKVSVNYCDVPGDANQHTKSEEESSTLERDGAIEEVSSTFNQAHSL